MRHPKKEVQAALEEIVADGWFSIEVGHGHWAVLKCGHGGRDGCQIWVNATPQNPGSHADKLVRLAARCAHRRVPEEHE